MLLNHLIYFSSQNREKNNHQTWKQLVPEYDTTKKGELHPVQLSTWGSSLQYMDKGPRTFKKRTTQKMEATHAGGEWKQLVRKQVMRKHVMRKQLITIPLRVIFRNGGPKPIWRNRSGRYLFLL